MLVCRHFLTQLKALGLAVKVDSNGLAPKVIAALLEQGLGRLLGH